MLKTKSGKPVKNVAIGTWKIDNTKIEQEVETLKFYFEQGVNLIDVVLSYDNGTTLEVVAKFLKMIKREDIFVNALITYGCNEPADIEKQIDKYLSILDTTYLDCVTLQALPAIGFDLDTYNSCIRELKKSGKFLSIGYSNITKEQLESLAENIDYYEGLYNLECKICEDTGIIESCLRLGVPFFAYQPLRRNRTSKQNYKELVYLSEKYGKTQNQIILNWIVKHKGISVLIKSSNKKHILENLDALNFDMQSEDYEMLDKFRNKEFDNLKVSYTFEEGKVFIGMVPNQPIGIL